MAQVVTAPRAAPVLRATARGGAANLVGAAFAGAGGIAITWLVAAGLGPARAGVFFAATSAFLLALAVARLGTPTGLVYWVARLRDTDPARLPGLIPAALLPVLGAALLVALTFMCSADTIAAWTTTDTAYAAALRLLAVFLPAAVLMEALLALSRGFGRMRPTVMVDKVSRTIAQLGLLALAVWLRPDPVSVTLAWAAPYLPAVLAAGLTPRLRERLRWRGCEWRSMIRPFWSYTAPRALAGVAQLALQRFDVLLVAALLGFKQAAVYTVATRFITVGQLICGAVGTSVQPRVARTWSRGDRGSAQLLYQVTTGWIVLACWPLYLLAAWYAPWYLRIFGPEYDVPAAVASVWVLAAGMLLATACGVVETMLAMVGRTTWQLYNVIGAVVVNIAVDLWLVPSIGILGAAIGWCAGIAVKNLLPLAQLAWSMRLHPVGRGSAIAMTLAAVCCGLIPGVVAPVGPFAMAAATVLGLTAYAVSAWRIRRTWLPSGDT